MGGPSNTSLDILGIEIGRYALRGVRLAEETAVVTAAAECGFGGDVVAADGVIDPSIFGPRLDELLMKLGVSDRSEVRVGFTIGPRNSGVGSGPAMTSWLEAQASNLREPMICSGGLGIAFVPSRAVDEAVKLASGAGIDLVRIDLAPVAAARAIGDQVEDLICVGSGQGWQARMRDFEVLEAMENTEIGLDDPLAIFPPSGPPRSISHYGWVELAPGLMQSARLDLGQLASATGVAIGVAYESPANLLAGKLIGCDRPDAEIDPALGHLADYEVVDSGGDATVRLQPRTPSGADWGQPETTERAKRTPRTAPTTALSPLRGASGAAPEQSEWTDTTNASDPITMFSPDTEVEQMMGERDRRLSVDIFIGLLVLSAVLLGLAYLFL